VYIGVLSSFRRKQNKFGDSWILQWERTRSFCQNNQNEK